MSQCRNCLTFCVCGEVVCDCGSFCSGNCEDDYYAIDDAYPEGCNVCDQIVHCADLCINARDRQSERDAKVADFYRGDTGRCDE